MCVIHAHICICIRHWRGGCVILHVTWVTWLIDRSSITHCSFVLIGVVWLIALVYCVSFIYIYIYKYIYTYTNIHIYIPCLSLCISPDYWSISLALYNIIISPDHLSVGWQRHGVLNCMYIYTYLHNHIRIYPLPTWTCLDSKHELVILCISRKKTQFYARQ